MSTQNKRNTKSKMLTQDMVGDEYGLTPSELKHLRERRLLAFVKLGHRSIRYMRRDIETLIQSHRVAAFREVVA